MAKSTIIAGTDWEGNPTVRTIVPGFRVALRGQFGEGFDVRGPHASMCAECHHISYVETAGALTGAIQDHYATAHSYTPALLP